jgi:hypothetical protein
VQHNWRQAGIEPAIEEMLADPIVHAIWRRDRIGETEVRQAIARARRAPVLSAGSGASRS